jgi:hypothetical protein
MKGGYPKEITDQIRAAAEERKRRAREWYENAQRFIDELLKKYLADSKHPNLLLAKHGECTALIKGAIADLDKRRNTIKPGPVEQIGPTRSTD